MEKARAVDILKKSIATIGSTEVFFGEYGSPVFEKWRRSTKLAIVRIFGGTSDHLAEFETVTYGTSSRDYQSGLSMVRALLESMREEIEDYWPEEGVEPVASQTSTKTVEARNKSIAKPLVFIGHGRSKLWARLQIFLKDELGLETITYESESRVGVAIVPILEKMLAEANFAVLVLTAEDETSEGRKRARQNVVHEAGLFQGRLGFKRAVVIRQEGLEDFSNVDGLQYISFRGDRIEDSFYELQRVLKREFTLPI